MYLLLLYSSFFHISKQSKWWTLFGRFITSVSFVSIMCLVELVWLCGNGKSEIYTLLYKEIKVENRCFTRGWTQGWCHHALKAKCGPHAAKSLTPYVLKRVMQTPNLEVGVEVFTKYQVGIIQNQTTPYNILYMSHTDIHYGSVLSRYPLFQCLCYICSPSKPLLLSLILSLMFLDLTLKLL